MSAIFQDRRGFLRQAAAGFGYTAFAGLAAFESLHAKGSQNPLLPKAPHFEPKAKRCDLPLHARRPHPARHVRLQSRSRQVRRHAFGDGAGGWQHERQDPAIGV